jgi:hypothetical protein
MTSDFLSQKHQEELTCRGPFVSLLAASCALVLVACSNVGSDETDARAELRSPGNVRSQDASSPPSTQQQAGVGGGASDGVEGSGANGEGRAAGTSLTDRTASSPNERVSVPDLVPDRGDSEKSPSYVEIVNASVERTLRDLQFVVRFQGVLPARMRQDDQTFTAGFDLETNENRGFSLIGVLNKEGWQGSFREKRSARGPLCSYPRRRRAHGLR